MRDGSQGVRTWQARRTGGRQGFRSRADASRSGSSRPSSRATLALALAAALTGCLPEDRVICADGVECPAGTTCVAPQAGQGSGSLCATDEQLRTCQGADEGTVCTLGVGAGVCLGTVCTVVACGDGVTHRWGAAQGEACDDGNTNDGDGCARDCRSTEACGNGILDAAAATPEQCDQGPGNADAPDAPCRLDCRLPRCGDGVPDPGRAEDCDDGAGNSDTTPNACRLGCRLPRCGDGVLDPASGETCDDGNASGGDGCSEVCGVEGCGDGSIDPDLDEQCDDGNLVDGDGCQRDCRLPRCGDGIVDASLTETCDDGTNNSNTTPDACRLGCRLPRCGDGIVDPAFAEACDDGGASGGDGCSELCQLETCGDGSLDPGLGEQCDDGNAVDGDGCQADCLIARCGDGVLDLSLGEACDCGTSESALPATCVTINAAVSDASCRPNCQPLRCGDGVVDPGDDESCDDGNLDSSDGCLPSCVAARCGDGVVRAGTEACDDGNGDDFDYCRNDCTRSRCGNGVREPGEACDDGNAGDDDACPRSCAPARCGDGFVWNGVEICDDGNFVDGDGCDNSCLPTCGDGVVDPGEACDDGNRVNDDTCNDACERLCPDLGQTRTVATSAACYLGFTATRTWAQAEAACVAVGGHLASVRSPAEAATVRTAAAPGAWLGLTDAGVEATWRWSDGPDPGLFSWQPGEPRNVTGLEDCGRFLAALPTWRAAPCTDLAPSVCELPLGATCGDGTVDPESFELCDDGPANDDDARCTSSCRLARCGDGLLHDGVEECDDGNDDDDDLCSNACVRPVCGDGVVQGVERCDDGNFDPGDGCPACLPASCGDGFLQAGVEVCEDGNQLDGDGCSSRCTLELLIVQLGVPATPIEVFVRNRQEKFPQAASLATCPLGPIPCSVPMPADAGEFGQLRIVAPVGTTFEGCDVSPAEGGCYVTASGSPIVTVSHSSAPLTVHQIGSGTGTTIVVDRKRRAKTKPWASRQPEWVRCPPGASQCSSLVPSGEQAGFWPTTGGSSAVLRVKALADSGQARWLAGCAHVNASNECYVDPGATTSVVVEFGSATCGDATLDLGEGCDDGNVENGDGCQAHCQPPTCGDGVIDTALGESCDDGNQLDGDTCRPGCWAALCGDGTIDAVLGETCDDGNSTSGDGCAVDCRDHPGCGDGVVDPGDFEQCDDGNVVDGDGCDGACRPELVIRKVGSASGLVVATERRFRGRLGVVEPEVLRCDAGEAICSVPVPQAQFVVDPSFPHRALWGPRSLRLLADAGTRWISGCDAIGTRERGNHCYVDPDKATTVVVAFTGGGCGNAILDAGEACDDGNQTDGDGCTGYCSVPICGDGIAEPGETCDDGNLDDDDSCRNDCQPPRCGDGIVQTILGEICDDGNQSSGDACALDCRDHTRCGDSVLDTSDGEICDDGNQLDGDGCASTCEHELTIVQEGRLSSPVMITGHRRRQGLRRETTLWTCPVGEPRCTHVMPRVFDSDLGDLRILPPKGATLTGCTPTNKGWCYVSPSGPVRVTVREDSRPLRVWQIGDGQGWSVVTPHNRGRATNPAQTYFDCDAGQTMCAGQVSVGFSSGSLWQVPLVRVRTSGTWISGCTRVNPYSNHCYLDPTTSTDLVIGFGNVTCGNGVLDAGEGCDDGNYVANDSCRPDCLLQGCGDQILGPGEECDDGNLQDGDGCEADCSLSSMRACGAALVDVERNEAHCGGCDLVCSGACDDARCDCGAGPVTLSDDPANCGACGVVCGGATPYCSQGTCAAVAPDCQAILNATPAALSGVYSIWPAGSASAFDAYCDMNPDDGGGWTLLERGAAVGTDLRTAAAVGLLTSPTQTSSAKLDRGVIASILAAANHQAEIRFGQPDYGYLYTGPLRGDWVTSGLGYAGSYGTVATPGLVSVGLGGVTYPGSRFAWPLDGMPAACSNVDGSEGECSSGLHIGSWSAGSDDAYVGDGACCNGSGDTYEVWGRAHRP